MNIPDVVRAYFAADKDNDEKALVGVFAPHAVVEDEAARHEGPAAIHAWWRAAKDRYQHVAEPVEATTTNNEVTVRAKVSGQFPSSPATLEFLFTIEDGQIVALRIS